MFVKVKQVRPVVFFMHFFTDPPNLFQKPPNHGASSGLKILFHCASNNCALFKAKTGPLSIKICYGQVLHEKCRIKLSNKVSA